MAAREEEATTVAAWAHYRLVALHRFHDGNGRTSRLVLVLSRAGLALLILPSESRDRYNELLRASNHGWLVEFVWFITFQHQSMDERWQLEFC